MRTGRILLTAAIALAAAGCQPAQKYYWGNYQDLVYIHYAEPGKVSPEQQIKIMETDLHAAEAKHQPMPPGFYAQLGYLYTQAGNKDAARENFEAEKRHFPESAVLMDRLLANLART